MNIKPLFTEKSLSEAKRGNYTFVVDSGITKNQIKQAINDAFNVHVVSVRTINKPKMTRRTMSGKIVTVAATKKAIVSLKEKENIDLFDQAKEDKK